MFCVNVDAIIAALLLAILWKDYRFGALNRQGLGIGRLQRVPLRVIGAAAEIDDRGYNMDMSSAGSWCDLEEA